jgi:hypothetical protein
MSERIQIKKEHVERPTEEVVEPDTRRQEAARAAGEAVMGDIDEILDEIDDLIQTGQFITAEEFLQKGGQAVLPISIESIMALHAHGLVVHGVKVVPGEISPLIIAILATVYAVIRITAHRSHQRMRARVRVWIKTNIVFLLKAGVKFTQLGAAARAICSSGLHPLLLAAHSAGLEFVGMLRIAMQISILRRASASATRKMRASASGLIDDGAALGTLPHLGQIVTHKGGQ